MVYGSIEGKIEESNLDRVVGRVGNGYWLCVLEDLSGCVGDWLRVGITGGFGVKAENDNGWRVIDFCTEEGLSVSSAYFECKSLHNYTWVARGQEELEVMSMINLGLVKKDMLRFVQDVRALTGMRRDCSDHKVVLC